MNPPKLFLESQHNKAQQIRVRILCDILHASSDISWSGASVHQAIRRVIAGARQVSQR